MSNLVESEELAKRFHKELTTAANSLMRTRYYSLFDYVEPDDVVMEVWNYVISHDISYDESRGNCKFSSFVMTLVSQRCLDLLKYYSADKRCNKELRDYSFDRPIDDDGTSLVDFIEDMSKTESYDMSILRSDIDEILNQYNRVPDKEIVREVIEDGSYLSTELRESKSDSSYRKSLRGIRVVIDVLRKRNQGSSVKLGDVIYNSDVEYDGSLLLNLKYIVDDKTGVSLFDVVKMVMKGFTYKEIANKVNSEEKDVRRFLNKYESLYI